MAKDFVVVSEPDMKTRFAEKSVHYVGTKALAVFGHRLYVRKCKPKRLTFRGPDGNELEIIRPEKSKGYCTWFEVLAIGPDVGKRRRFKDKADRKHKADAVMHLAAEVNKGDFVALPDDHWGTKSSPWSEHEFFVDEAALLAVMPRNDENGG